MEKIDYQKLLNQYNYYKKITNLSFKEKMLKIETFKNNGFDQDSKQVNCCFWISIKNYFNNEYSVDFLKNKAEYTKKNKMVSFNNYNDIKCIKRICAFLDIKILIYSINIINNQKYVNPYCQFEIGKGNIILRIGHYYCPFEHFELIKNNKNNLFIDYTENTFNKHQKKIEAIKNKKKIEVFKKKISDIYHIKNKNKALCNQKINLTTVKKLKLDNKNICKRCLYLFN